MRSERIEAAISALIHHAREEGIMYHSDGCVRHTDAEKRTESAREDLLAALDAPQGGGEAVRWMIYDDGKPHEVLPLFRSWHEAESQRIYMNRPGLTVVPLYPHHPRAAQEALTFDALRARDGEWVAREAARRACEEIAGSPVLLTSDAVDAIVDRASTGAIAAGVAALKSGGGA